MRASRIAALTLAAVIALVGLQPSAQAQTTAGSGTVLVIPLAAAGGNTNYASTVFVANPSTTTAITVNVKYYLSNDTASPPPTAKPWLVACTPLSIPAGQVVSFDLATQCPPTLGGVTITDNFGMIVLEDAASPKVNAFTAYSRQQSSNTNVSFSIEAFPIGNFSSADANVIGLQRTPTGLAYLSNCFVGSLGEPVNVQIAIYDGGGALRGATQVSLGKYEMSRKINVFTAAGLAPGAYSNMRATFTNTDGNGAAFVPFCTVESRSNSSADFRVAKSIDANDQRQLRTACYGQSQCGTVSSIDITFVPDGNTRNIHFTIFDQPDFVKCSLVYRPGDEGKLEMMLRGPGIVDSTTPFTVPAPYTNVAGFTAGGPGAQSFYIYTGERSTIGGGLSTRWYIDVQQIDLTSTTAVDYGITCTSGNGITIPWLGAMTGAAW